VRAHWESERQGKLGSAFVTLTDPDKAAMCGHDLPGEGESDAGAIAVSLAWATVAGHSDRIARANPVLALRYE